MVAVEAVGHDLGWTAVARFGQGDAFLSLRNARALPMTMRWHSNAGRDDPPWNGRHLACFGIEEGWAPHMLGEQGGLRFEKEGLLDIRHAIGAIAWPTEERIRQIRAIADGPRMEGAEGTFRDVGFDIEHLFPGKGGMAK